jgi:diguanylate cyclase (GGDEF)-like protein/PAS domain S-box-containing protein
MIVQYYWTRTGYFTLETFWVWLSLEILAIAGSLLFTHSFGQSLAPLQGMGHLSASGNLYPRAFYARSTDELGMIANSYSDLLLDLKNHNEIISLTRETLFGLDYDSKLEKISSKVINLCKDSLLADISFLILFDKGSNKLLGVAQTDSSYNPDGYYQLGLDEKSIASKAFNDKKTLIVNDASNDPHVSPSLQKQFGIASCLATPLLVQNKCIGVILSAFQKYRHIFTPREINFIEGIAHETAQLVYTQMLYEERDKARRESQQRDQYIHTMFDATSEGIISVNNNMQCEFLNQAAIDMLGYNSEEIAGCDIYQLVHESDQQGNKIPYEQCLILRSLKEKKSFYSDNELFKTATGDVFPVQFSANPIIENDVAIGSVVVFRNIAEEKAIENKLNYLATHDSLTGLINRHEFENRLEQVIHESQVDQSLHALCYLDLDQFKIVNDTCGHIAGDELLRQLATLLKSHLRQGDTLARLGGDEFGVLFPHCEQDKALQLAEQTRKTIENFRFSWETKNFSIGVSIGVVPITPLTDNKQTALSAADAACYIAKDTGRNRIHLYHDEDSGLVQHYGEMHWVNRLNEAFENNDFILYYQPVAAIDNIDKTNAFIEILLRIDNEGSLVPPGAFIPAAERYNLMPALDRWVIKHTLAWLKSNKDKISQLETCSINVSGTSIGDQNFLHFIIDQLESRNIPVEKICFEITETTAVSNLTQALHFITELKSRGCRFALDDFGSGMSSFSYLKTLPVDYLKIDGNFVRNIANDSIDRTMVDAINQVGQVMHIKTIAEFVENTMTLDELRAIGIDYVQGYGISHPMPLAAYGTTTP